MKYKECYDCIASLACVSEEVYPGYCSSLKRRYLVVGDHGRDNTVVMMPDGCPAADKVKKLECSGDYGNDSRSQCGMCKVTMAVLREKMEEEKRDVLLEDQKKGAVGRSTSQ
jgi:hypothetical protein